MNTDSIMATQQQLTVAEEVLETLHRWSERGWIRRMDSAMANFIHRLDKNASPALLVATAILVQMEGSGHTCLSIKSLESVPIELLGCKETDAEFIQELTKLWETLPQKSEDWVTEIFSSRIVKSESCSDAGELDQISPLVLNDTSEMPLLYLKRYWDYERTVGEMIESRLQIVDMDNEPNDKEKTRHWLGRLFKRNEADPEPRAEDDIDWQKLACAIALRGNLSIITGGPGTGKTYTAARLLTLLIAMNSKSEPLRIALAAPTGKAAARLSQSIEKSLAAFDKSDPKLKDDLGLDDHIKHIGKARTLHSLLGATLETRQFRFSAKNQLKLDVLIVDEASMVNLEMMAALLQALPSQAKLIFLGDKDQLSSVEAGAVMGDLCKDAEEGHYNEDTNGYAQHIAGESIPTEFISISSNILNQQTIMLRKNKRSEDKGPIAQLAAAVNAGNKDVNLEELTSSGVFVFKSIKSTEYIFKLAVEGRKVVPDSSNDNTKESTKQTQDSQEKLVESNPKPIAFINSYADYLNIMRDGLAKHTQEQKQHEIWVKAILQAFDHFRILCSVHEGEWGTKSINLNVQKELEKNNLIDATGEWYAGRPIMVTRNDRAIKVLNGDVGVVLPSFSPQSDKPTLRAYFLDGDMLRSVSVGRLANVETAFAKTVHKSQGSEFAHTALVLSPGADDILTRELVYTGITRAKQMLTVIEGKEGLLVSAIARKTKRASGLNRLLNV